MPKQVQLSPSWYILQAKALREVTWQEWRDTDTATALRNLEGVFSLAVSQPIRKTSGLVEMQRLFSKYYREDPEIVPKLKQLFDECLGIP